ncbi:hypothetical protein [Escherichia coli]|nr:hypothetical protein [Escherichia coli]
MSWIYPEVIERLQHSCKNFLEGKITVQSTDESPNDFGKNH